MHAPLTVKKCIWDHVPAEIRYLGLFQLSYLGLAWKTTMQQVQILWGIHGLELFVVVVLFCWLTDCNRQSSSISTYDNLFWIKPLELFNFTCIASSLKKEIGQLRTWAPVQNYPLIRTETIQNNKRVSSNRKSSVWVQHVPVQQSAGCSRTGVSLTPDPQSAPEWELDWVGLVACTTWGGSDKASCSCTT